ncbi:Uncharacterised protein [Mycobacteroides abscessus subsp. abscessus]|nr:Uncharacterised protein [Mycobacteroides abscessus subsp. abscessus]
MFHTATPCRASSTANAVPRFNPYCPLQKPPWICMTIGIGPSTASSGT